NGGAEEGSRDHPFDDGRDAQAARNSSGHEASLAGVGWPEPEVTTLGPASNGVKRPPPDCHPAGAAGGHGANGSQKRSTGANEEKRRRLLRHWRRAAGPAEGHG